MSSSGSEKVDLLLVFSLKQEDGTFLYRNGSKAPCMHRDTVMFLPVVDWKDEGHLMSKELKALDGRSIFRVWFVQIWLWIVSNWKHSYRGRYYADWCWIWIRVVVSHPLLTFSRFLTLEDRLPTSEVCSSSGLGLFCGLCSHWTLDYQVRRFLVWKRKRLTCERCFFHTAERALTPLSTVHRGLKSIWLSMRGSCWWREPTHAKEKRNHRKKRTTVVICNLNIFVR